MKIILPILMSLLLAEAAFAQPLRLPPRDECARDASFAAFRSQLLAVIDRKDAKGLLALTAEDIAFSFGGGQGKPDFIQSWKLEGSQQSPIWKELAGALGLGCAVAPDYFAAPSMFADFPEDLDFFEHVVAVTPAAFAHAAPDILSERLLRLDHDILMVTDGGGGDWLGVKLADGRVAFVRREDVRSPIDYRAIFEKRDGRWLMTAFLAGD